MNPHHDGVQGLVVAQASLGECALWCERSQSLLWTDIDRGLLSRWHAAHGQVQTWALPQPLGSFVLCETPDRLLLGLARGLAFFDLTTGELGPVQPLPDGAWKTRDARLNDGRCDPQGRYVFGLFNPHGEATGDFWRVDHRLQPERLPLPPAQVANALSFSPDGHWLYFTDSPTRCIQRARYDADGRVGPPQPWLQLASDDGEPDGATVDAEGRLWVALWGAASLLCVAPHGQVLQRWPLPVSHPTCPVFGGPGLDRLMLTSARKALAGEALAREPLAGDVLTWVPRLPGGGRVRGLPPHRFANVPRA
jgi:L-arabinonolactonase